MLFPSPSFLAIYGSLFATESEAAFSNYRMWESIGQVIVFGYSNALCTSIKLYILTSFLILGFCGYALTEIISRKAESAASKERNGHVTTGHVTKSAVDDYPRKISSPSDLPPAYNNNAYTTSTDTKL